MAIVSACVSLDWVVSVLVLAYALAIFLLKRELYLGALFRLANAVLLGIYVGIYIYMAYLLPYVNEEYVAIFVAMAVVVVVLILLYWLDNSALILALVVVMSSYGLIWWAMSLIAVFVGVAAAFIVWRNELDYLTMCFFDSAVLAIVICIDVVGIFTNFWPQNAPDTCSTEHVNILVVCENACASVLTDGGIRMNLWQWGIFILGLASLRFGWVIWKEVCPQKEKVKAAYEQQHPRRQCCSRCQPEDQRDCCFCLCRLCAAAQPTAFHQLTKSDPEVPPSQQEEAEMIARALQRQAKQRPLGPESKRPQQQEEAEEDDEDLERALEQSLADLPPPKQG